MKNFLLLAILGFSLNLFAQMQVPELKFIFENKSDFTEQFQDKENSKQFTFKVEGLNKQEDIQNLQTIVSKARGVEEFKVETNNEGQLVAEIKVYRYATGFWYWSVFMDKTGIPTFNIESVDYDKNTIKK